MAALAHRRPKRRPGLPGLPSVPRLDPSTAPPGAVGSRGVPLGVAPAWIVGAIVVRQGGPQDETQLAGIIGLAKCESRYNSKATSRNPSGGTNRGWWQIDDKSHPEFGEQCLHDPICSTDAMLKISDGGKDFSQWACKPTVTPETRAAAKEALEKWQTVEARATAGGGIPNPLSGLDAVATAVEAMAKFFVGLGELLLTPEGWIRLGKLLVGGILIVWGISKLAGRLGGGKVAKAGRSTASKVAGAAATVVPEARAAKIAGAV